MEDNLTVEKATQMAVNEAARKNAEGHLYRPGEDEDHEWGNGDPETIYSLASCYAQFTEDYNAAHDVIVDKLAGIYGDDFR